MARAMEDRMTEPEPNHAAEGTGGVLSEPLAVGLR